MGGIGIFWGDENEELNISESFNLLPVTNNRTELYAVLKAIKMFTLFKLNKRKENILVIHTDSRLTIDILTKWIKKWKYRNWLKSNNKKPLNLDIIIPIDNIIEENKSKFKVEFKHVSAHRAEPSDKKSDEHFYWYGNNKADYLARVGANKLI